METRKSGTGKAAVGRLKLAAIVAMAEGELSGDEVERARNDGRIALPALPEGEARLEVGGVTVATGRIVRKRGVTSFEVRATAAGREGRK